MTSKVLVKLPLVPFSQRKKPPPEIISLPNRNDESDEGRFQGHNSDKVTQLEQNMKFLQDQHQATLVALHQEVEILRQRNRDLQFQLIFSKGTNYASSSPSSPEDSGNGFAKPKQGSPASVNVAPLQVELLEKDLQDMKSSLNEAKTRNIYLSEVIEKQKKSLELSEKSKEKQKVTDVGVQVDGVLECQQVELQARLDDAEALVKRLRQENEDQRKEIATIKSSSSAGYNSNGNNSRSGSSRNRGAGQNAYHNRGPPANDQGQEENYHKFPPLQTQSYWHRASRGNHSYDHNSQSDYHRNSRHHQDRQELEADLDITTVLPQLRNGSVRVDNSSSYPPFFRSRGHHSGGNYYKDERGQQNRKYRGQKAQRDRRDQEPREYHREYKDSREPKENQRQHQFSESAKGARNSQRQ
ncbi:hypothetical protein TSAR_012626 [Trichomalopsis sarcophagae]|uniref:CCDC92/74 N-terminal domain-containing protein n=1 Tax=Trichomalopsis sarcophagae TaxID=543379 RepID=A0A232F4J9_9HYME|nr:hypothetical protein TSAR_012626 [Trichomalopsis sarcophagae]